VDHHEHQVGIALENPAEEKVSDRHGRLGGPADHVLEEVATEIDSPQRVVGVKQDQAAEVVGHLPEGVQSRLVQGHPVDVGSDLGSDHPQLAD
jgi:hypothetical protein